MFKFNNSIVPNMMSIGWHFSSNKYTYRDTYLALKSMLEFLYLPALPDSERHAIHHTAMDHQRVVDVNEEGHFLVSRGLLNDHTHELFGHSHVRHKLRTFPNARVINSLKQKSQINTR